MLELKYRLKSLIYILVGSLASEFLGWSWKTNFGIENHLCHTSKINVLCSSLNSKEMLHFLYLYKKKTEVVFFVFHFKQLSFLTYECYVNIDQGIHKGKMKVAQNEKRKKLLGFSFYINIGNFEAFLWNLNLSAKHLFWRCCATGSFI